jgi:O-antigen/teichoic acid export membrane protein
MNRLKLAELTSGVGALVLGVGLGALFPRWFGAAAGLITVAGLSLHAFGMWDKHRLEAVGEVKNPLWIVALYWVCWLALAVVAAMLIVSNRS